jgi:FkbM family methyltransferase
MGLNEITAKLFYSSPLVRWLAAGPNSLRHWIKNKRQKQALAVLSVLRERLSDDVVVSVPEFGGSFQMPTSSDIFRRICLDGHYEPALSSIAAKFVASDRDAIDVGANIGFYSVLLSGKVASGRVLAIEPHPMAYQRLMANLKRNNAAGKTIMFQGIAGASLQRNTISFPLGMEEYTTVRALQEDIDDPAITRCEVDETTVDALVQEHSLDPAFIKIDVEGYEYEVLQGAVRVIRTSRPVILCELNDDMLRKHGSSSALLLEFFRANGYRCTDPKFPKLQVGRRPTGDLLALPE